MKFVNVIVQRRSKVDEHGYMSRYSFQESIRDKATLPLHFEAPEVRLKIDKDAVDEAYRQIRGPNGSAGAPAQ